MAVRYNNDADRLALAVGDLLYVERATDPRLPGDLSSRSELGRDLHIRISEQRASSIEDYRSEVDLEWRMVLDGAEVTVFGRLDGCWTDEGMMVVEEVKSTFASPHLLPYPSHRMQLQLYLAILAEQQQTAARGELTYLHPISIKQIGFQVNHNLSTFAEAQRRILAILTWHRREAKRLAGRTRQANRIRWPYSERRPGQDQMEAEVRSALETGHHLLISAPTGSGKTAPTLLTAFAYTCATGKRLAFATSRTSQQMDRVDLLRLAVPPDTLGRVLVMSAQERLREGFELAGENENPPFDPWEPPHWFLEWLDAGEILTSEQVRSIASTQKIDPVLVQTEAARYADVLIGDMNLLAIPFPGIRSLPRRSRFTREEVLLIDEAHGLPDRLRDQRAARLSPPDLRRLASTLEETVAKPVAAELASIFRELALLIDSMLKKDGDSTEQGGYERTDPADPLLTPHLIHAGDLISSSLSDTLPETLTDTLFEVYRASAAAAHPMGYAAYLDRFSGACCWELAETGPVLQTLSDRYGSIVAFSATLDPLDMARDELGLDVRNTRYLRLPDPYGPDQRLILRCNSIDTTFRSRAESIGELADLLSDCLQASDGNWLVFLPSRAYLELLERRLVSKATPVLALRSGMPPALFVRMLASIPSPSLHLALMGGTMAEGTNPIDAGYRGLAVVSIGMPPTSPRAELLRVVSEERGESGLLRAYLLPGLKRVQQAAGRLIRGPNQRGVLLLIDPRYARPDIEQLLPDSWQESPVMNETQEIPSTIEEWFGRN